MTSHFGSQPGATAMWLRGTAVWVPLSRVQRIGRRSLSRGCVLSPTSGVHWEDLGYISMCGELLKRLVILGAEPVVIGSYGIQLLKGLKVNLFSGKVVIYL